MIFWKNYFFFLLDFHGILCFSFFGFIFRRCYVFSIFWNLPILLPIRRFIYNNFTSFDVSNYVLGMWSVTFLWHWVNILFSLHWWCAVSNKVVYLFISAINIFAKIWNVGRIPTLKVFEPRRWLRTVTCPWFILLNCDFSNEFTLFCCIFIWNSSFSCLRVLLYEFVFVVGANCWMLCSIAVQLLRAF